MSLNPTDVDGFGRLRDLKISESEIGPRHGNNYNNNNNTGYRGKCTLITINTPLTQPVTILMSQLRTEKIGNYLGIRFVITQWL
jgi:hypothetical protein